MRNYSHSSSKMTRPAKVIFKPAEKIKKKGTASSNKKKKKREKRVVGPFRERNLRLFEAC